MENSSPNIKSSESVSDSNKKLKKSEDDLANETNEQSVQEENKEEKLTDFATIVATHYNSLESIACEERHKCKIFYLRNFNNWAKTIIINQAVSKLFPHNQYNKKLTVLDMCCGRGGDIIKWLKLNIKYLVCADIAETSLEFCKERFRVLSKKLNRDNDVESEIISADCTRVRLRSKYKDPSVKFDIVSCQFSFHYSFESLPQAECMLKNASECLKPGGFFIGTIPNAYEIVKRLRKSESKCIKNQLFKLEMHSSEPYSLFGASYNFYLADVVNCPEFLIHFPTFVKLASRFGLELVSNRRFDELYEENKNTEIGRRLLKKMKALETYPPFEDKKKPIDVIEYQHAALYADDESKVNIRRVGTISKSEWEIITLYQTFIFRKT